MIVFLNNRQWFYSFNILIINIKSILHILIKLFCLLYMEDTFSKTNFPMKFFQKKTILNKFNFLKLFSQ